MLPHEVVDGLNQEPNSDGLALAMVAAPSRKLGWGGSNLLRLSRPMICYGRVTFGVATLAVMWRYVASAITTCSVQQQHQ
jgi:hypothetical protein